MDKYWKKVEREFAKLLEGRRIWLSRSRKGSEDVISDKVVMDVKSTKSKKSLSIKREDLEKIVERGKELNLLGVLGFKFYRDRNKYVVMSFEDFKRLTRWFNGYG